MDKQFYISSTKHSIRERQTKHYGKVYDIRFRIIDKNGVEIHKKLSGFANKTLAKQGHTDFITNYCTLIKNNPIKHQKRLEESKEVATIKDLSNTYFLAMRNQLKDSSIYDAQNIFRLFVLKKFGNYQLKNLTKKELILWQDELWSMKNPKNNEYYSYKYLSRIKTTFSSFLSWCADRNEDFTNYLLEIKKPKKRVQKTEMKIWAREDFEQFISVVDNVTYKTFFAVLFFTGRRKGEVFALTHDDITKDYIKFNKSLTRKTIDNAPYKITSTKAEKSASSPICEPLKKILNEYKAPKGKFFFGGNTPIAENTLTRAFNNYCNIAKVKLIRLHDLRHSFVSMMISLGGSIPIVADLISDSIEVVSKTYAHLYMSDKEKLISKIL